MALSVRLRSVLDEIHCSALADIGCDHGQVAVRAVEEGRADKVYACDVKEGPLSRARALIESKDLQGKITCRLQDGLKDLPVDVDQVVIAGMGGDLIAGFLDDVKEHPNLKTLILLPHKDAPILRKALAEQGLSIRFEKMVQEEHHFYPLMMADTGQMMELAPEEEQFGKNPVHSPERRAFLKARKQQIEMLLDSMPENERKKELLAQNAMLKTLMQREERA